MAVLQEVPISQIRLNVPQQQRSDNEGVRMFPSAMCVSVEELRSLMPQIQVPASVVRCFIAYDCVYIVYSVRETVMLLEHNVVDGYRQAWPLGRKVLFAGLAGGEMVCVFGSEGKFCGISNSCRRVSWAQLPSAQVQELQGYADFEVKTRLRQWEQAAFSAEQKSLTDQQVLQKYVACFAKADGKLFEISFDRPDVAQRAQCEAGFGFLEDAATLVSVQKKTLQILKQNGQNLVVAYTSSELGLDQQDILAADVADSLVLLVAGTMAAIFDTKSKAITKQTQLQKPFAPGAQAAFVDGQPCVDGIFYNTQ